MKKLILVLVFVLFITSLFSDTLISFSVSEPGRVTLKIYNIKGEKVKTLIDDNLSATNHTIIWNGKDESNNTVSSGIYFYKMKHGTYTSTKKIILMK